ncbi:MAG: hypothetical protein LBJ23_05685, partial [Tannerella sp.]|nr:hypothetical protein [Tannerella sp.]
DRFRAFVSEYLQNNSAVTDDDRNAMGVPVHKKTRTPAKRPDTIPSLKNLIHRASRVYELFVVDATHEGRAKPPQVHGYEVGYLIGLAGLTVVPEQFTHSIFDTRTPCILHFEPETLGQTLYIAFRWENTIGEKGDWSEVYSFVIG